MGRPPARPRALIRVRRPWDNLRVRWALAAVALSSVALVGAAGAPGAAERTDPIVGTWSYGGGAVTVRPAGKIYEGIVVRDVRFLECLHRSGERMWTIVRTRSGYAGRQFSFGAGIGCGKRIWVSANWRVADHSLRFWVARRSSQWPRACGEQTDCFRLTRAVAPRRAAGPARWRIAIHVNGRPDRGRGTLPAGYESSTATGTGSFALEQGRVAGLSGAVSLVHRPGERTMVRIGGALKFARYGTSRVLRVAVSVVSSTGSCAAGSKGSVWLEDSPVADVFAVSLCGKRLEFQDGLEGAVVNVRLARAG